MVDSKKQDGVFYEAFQRHADCLVEAARKLSAAFDDLEKAGELAEQIRELEHQGDKITHDTIARLHKTWITPLDSADIRRLITTLDDVLDLTEAVSERIVLFEIVTTQEDAQHLARVLVRSSEAVSKALHLLPTLKRSREILDLCIEINRLENEADRAHHAAVRRLFEEERDPIAIIKWKEILDFLEDATDRCEDVANVLEGVVVKHA